MLNALSQGMTDFEVFENMTRNPEMINLNDYDKMSQSFLYDNHVSYSLLSALSNYVNLDNEMHAASFGSIHELAESHIIQCGHEQTTSDGTFLVGSARGSWINTPAIKHALTRSMAHLSQSHLKAKKDKGLMILRRVVRSENFRNDQGDIVQICSKLHTETVHPLELFSEMKMVSISESPFQHTYMNRDASPEGNPSQRSRKELSNVIYPDAPIVACDSNQGYFSGYISGSGNSYSYALGAVTGCAEYSNDYTAYNFNYNPNTRESGKALNYILNFLIVKESLF